MTPEDNLNKEIWWVLKQIKKEEILNRTEKGDLLLKKVISIDDETLFETEDGVPSVRLQNRILFKLEDMEAISIESIPNLNFNSDMIIPGGALSLSKEKPIKRTLVIRILEPKFDEVYKKYENLFLPHIETVQVLSKADEKRLNILEKLKEKYDLAPKKNDKPLYVQSGISSYLIRAGEVNISQQKYNSWFREYDIDYNEFQNILATFRQDGLITDFDFIPDFI